MSTRYPILIKLIFIFSLFLNLFANFNAFAVFNLENNNSNSVNNNNNNNNNNNAVQTIFLGVDGLSYNAFKFAQAKGLFLEFSGVGAHVAPFPSMTDLSWATIMHTAEVFGQTGRIKSVEATYFDDASQSVQGDPRDYYRRLSFPKYYMGAFEHFFNPYIEALMYFPTEEVPKLEIKTVIDELIAAPAKKIMTGYVGAVDSTAHTQLNRLFPVMKILDQEIKRLIQAYKDKGQEIEVVLVSDHGNIGRFQEGKPEQELLGVQLGEAVKAAGFNYTQQLKNKNDVAVPLLALGSWAPVYLKDQSNKAKLIQALKNEIWFDLAVTIKRNNESETIMSVTAKDGDATITFDKKNKLYYYFSPNGNPLHIAADFISTQNNLRPILQNQVLTVSSDLSYPDAIYRLIESASQQNFDFPDFILSLKDGFYINSSFGAFTKMYRTHGSLSAASTFGLVASTQRKIPGQIRSSEILSFLNIDPKNLFGTVVQKFDATGAKALTDALFNSDRGVETLAKDSSQKRIFQYISKFVSDTRPYFVVSQIKNLLDAFNFDPNQAMHGSKNISPLQFDMSRFNLTSMIGPEDVGAISDAVLTAGSVEKLVLDPRLKKVKERVETIKGSKISLVEFNESKQNSPISPEMQKYILVGKQSVMKMYHLPYLLEKSIVVQEKEFLHDPRNLNFAKYWLSQKHSAIQSYNELNQLSTSNSAHLDYSAHSDNSENESYSSQLTVVQNLLKETTKEADLEDRIYPTSLAKIYGNHLDDLTIVYVPGIYNSIFDKEIFSLGLNAISDDLGLRVIQPPVEATCSSDYNSDLIMNYLQNDIQAQVLRGQKEPRYIMIGYSKGAVDTLYAFAKSGEFVSKYIKGFVSIAGPLHGSSILNTTDLPFALVAALSEKEGPQICKTEKTASQSITPSAMSTFWRKNENTLIGMTRYFSVTFASDPEDSHIFMKATKLIGQFDEDNDGVVTVSSSKFPKKLMALDLGTIKADHLSGILSSRFNQKAFMKGLVNSLSELNINNDNLNLRWNEKIVTAAANESILKTSTFTGLTHINKALVVSLKGEQFLKKVPFQTSWELNQNVIPEVNDPAANYEAKIKLPPSQLNYDPYSVLDVSKLSDILAVKKVTPSTRINMPTGINIEYNHKNMVHFRMDHQFNYESRSPQINLDDNKNYGYATTDFNGEPQWALMKSQNNSIRMTTMAYRFSPAEMSKMSLKLAVTKGVKGADPVKGGLGIDDSAFQVWFTLRIGNTNNDRTIVDPKKDKMVLFGYYWGDPVVGEHRVAGQIFENWYSNKNVVIATLPEAKELLLNNPEDKNMLGKTQIFNRNLAQDLANAFPGVSPKDMEVIAITFQHDSNDAKDSSEAYFKSLTFQP